MVYRHLLQFIQEEVRREGKNPMIMWLYDMNVRLFLAKGCEYDNTTLEYYMKTMFKTKDEETMEVKHAFVPAYQATFHKKQHTPHRSYGNTGGGEAARQPHKG